jgi:hypothetical protein
MKKMVLFKKKRSFYTMIGIERLFMPKFNEND